MSQLKVEVAVEVGEYHEENGDHSRFMVHTIHGRIPSFRSVRSEEVKDVLLEMVDSGILKWWVEADCPKCQDFPVAGRSGMPSELIGEWLLCENCGNEFEVTEDNLLDWFEIA